MSKNITIELYKGISQTPYGENALVMCCDTETIPGSIQANVKPLPTSETSGTFGLITKIEDGLACDTSGGIWEYDVSNKDWDVKVAQNAQSTNSMNVWKDYVFLYRGGDIDVFPRGGSGTTTLNWQTDAVEIGLVGQDDILYMAINNVVRSVSEVVGQNFDPTDSATYTYNEEALDLPETENITTLAEIGRYLAIGTLSGNVYLWDRVSSSFQIPVKLPNTVKMLISANAQLYAVLSSGDIYVTNGTSAQLAKKFPRHILQVPFEPGFDLYPHAYRVEEDKIYIGYGTTNPREPIGIFSYNMGNGDFKLDYILADGSTGESSSTKIKMTALQNGDDFLFAYQKGGNSGTHGIQLVRVGEEGRDRYTGGIATVYSPVYKIGSPSRKATIHSIQVDCVQRLTENTSVSVYYREGITSAWEEVGTVRGANQVSDMIQRAVPDLSSVQLKVSLEPNDNVSPIVNSITLWIK